MTARKAATKLPPRKGPVLPEQSEAATFDVAAWLDELKAQGFKPQNIEVPLHLRGDLLPRINTLVEQIQQLQDGPEREEGIDDADPLGELTAEYERLLDEFHDGGKILFTFRPVNKRIQNETYKAWVAKHGEKPKDMEAYAELILSRMAAACVSFPGSEKFGGAIPWEAFAAFEELYGAAAFATLQTGFNAAYEAGGGGEPGAPFLPKASPIPGTGG